MTSVMTLDGVTLLWCLKDNKNTCKHMRNSPTIAGFLHSNGEKLEEAERLQMCFRGVLCV